MLTPRHALLTLLWMIGCAPSTAKVGVEGEDSPSSSGSSSGSGGDDSVEEDKDEDDPIEEEEEEEQEQEEAPFPYTGDYAGEMAVLATSSWGDYELASCALEASVSEDGDLSGEASCGVEWGGGGEDYTFPFSGTVDEDGQATGSMSADLGQPIELVMTGTVTEDGEMDLRFVGDFSEWGAELIGEAALTRD